MKRKEFLSFFLVILSATSMFFTSCKEDETEWFPVKGSGGIQLQERSVPQFTRIRSSISANITITKNSTRNVEILAQENLISLLETEVIDGTLYISFGKHAIISDSLVSVTINQSELSEITLAGSGVAVSELPVSTINITGSSSLRCSGATDQVSVRLSGSGTVNLEDMTVRKADVKISGNGNVSLHVSDDLNVSIPGTGIVYYQGQPKIQKSITGFGQVISKN